MRVVLLLGLVLSAAPSVALAAPPAEAMQALAAIAEREDPLPPERLTLLVTDRQLRLRGPATMQELEKPLQGATARELKGVLAYTRDAWLRTLQPAGPDATRSRSRTAWSGGILRNLAETERDGQVLREGRLVRAPHDAPGDAILTQRVRNAAAGILWTEASARGGAVTLTGSREKEIHRLILLRPGYIVDRWEIDRDVETPDGGRFTQLYRCEVSKRDAASRPELVREWILNPPPVGLASLRETTVQAREPLPLPAAVHVALRFPPGTEVIDARGETTLEYTESALGTDEGELAEAAAAIAANRVRPGQPAPALQGRAVKGELPSPADLKGHPVFLFWFTPGSRFSEEWSPIITEMSEDYTPLGFRFVGLAIPDKPGDEAIGTFATDSGWKFPVIIDQDAALLRRMVGRAGVPAVAVIDAEGILRHAGPGVELEILVPLLDKLTNRKPGEGR